MEREPLTKEEWLLVMRLLDYAPEWLKDTPAYQAHAWDLFVRSGISISGATYQKIKREDEV